MACFYSIFRDNALLGLSRHVTANSPSASHVVFRQQDKIALSVFSDVVFPPRLTHLSLVSCATTIHTSPAMLFYACASRLLWRVQCALPSASRCLKQSSRVRHAYLTTVLEKQQNYQSRRRRVSRGLEPSLPGAFIAIVLISC